MSNSQLPPTSGGDLSRRVAFIIDAPAILALSVEERLAFGYAVGQAASSDKDLEDKWLAVILLAEAETLADIRNAQDDTTATPVAETA